MKKHIPLYLLTFLLGTALTVNAKTMSVKGENVNLRSGPGTSYSVKWEYGSGFPLKILDKKGDWIKVSDFEKDTGWIHKSLVNDKQFVIVDVHRNSKKKINIRSGPTTKDKIVGQAYYGVVFERVEMKSGWSKVRHETGLEGWIKDTLLWGDE